MYKLGSENWHKKSQVLIHTVWCNITVEATGEIWTWSLLGVKGLNNLERSAPYILTRWLYVGSPKRLPKYFMTRENIN